MTVNVFVDGLVAEHILPQRLIAHLHRTAEDRILQQPLPKGWRRIVAGSLEAPSLQVVGVGIVRIAVGQVIVPYRACHELAARTVSTQLLLIEIGAALIAVGIEAQLGMNEIIDKRGYVDIAGIARLGVCKPF